MNPELEKQMRAAKAALGNNDPAVAALEAMEKALRSMQKAVEEQNGKIDAIQYAGKSLRIVRIRNFFLILFAGIVLGGAGAGYWMNGHGYMGGFWQHGIKVLTQENKDRLGLTIKGNNILTCTYEKDAQGNVIGFTVIYWKEKQP